MNRLKRAAAKGMVTLSLVMSMAGVAFAYSNTTGVKHFTYNNKTIDYEMQYTFGGGGTAYTSGSQTNLRAFLASYNSSGSCLQAKGKTEDICAVVTLSSYSAARKFCSKHGVVNSSGTYLIKREMTRAQ